jgi:predicted proteasome-type protease
LLNEGMVCLSDTRTNAGLDNISTYRKMFTFEDPGERVIVIMTAGSLSVTQTTSPACARRSTTPRPRPTPRSCWRPPC